MNKWRKYPRTLRLGRVQKSVTLLIYIYANIEKTIGTVA